MNFRKVLAAVCSIAMVASTMAFSTVNASAATKDPADMVFEIIDGKTPMSQTARAKSNYITISMPDIGGSWNEDYTEWSGKFMKSGSLRLAVETGILKDAGLSDSPNFLYAPDGEKGDSNLNVAFAQNYKQSGYDLITLSWACGKQYGLLAENDDMAEIKLTYASPSYSEDITFHRYEIPGDKFSQIYFTDIDGYDIGENDVTVKGLNPDYTYTLSATSNKVTATKNSSGNTTVEVGTITGTTEDDVKDYDGFKATTNIGGYTGETEADKATAFTAAISGTSASGNLVWKVTSDGTTKYRKQSIGGNFSGEANVGLVVSGMQDTAATAEVAFWN